MREPIAITGIGVASPAGTTAESLWRYLVAQEDARARWPKRALREYPVDNVVPIGEARWREIMDRQGRPDSRAQALASFVVARALDDARLDVEAVRTGCILASTTAGVELAEDTLVGRTSKHSLFDGSTVLPAGYRWRGPASVISTACSSGLLAPALAADALRTGEVDAMIAGGVEVLLEYTICGFNALRLATDDRCRPFDSKRRGVVLSEGAACFCLERLDSALRRGVPIRAVILGYALGCDADHVTALNAERVAPVIEEALAASGIDPASVGGVIAHGTGTAANDPSEIAALRRAFGEAALPPVTSIKAVMGHSQAAAGSFSLLAAILALRNGQLPATAGLREIDPDLGSADIVQGSARALTRNCLLVQAFGFGGNDCAMVVAEAAGERGSPR